MVVRRGLGAGLVGEVGVGEGLGLLLGCHIRRWEGLVGVGQGDPMESHRGLVAVVVAGNHSQQVLLRVAAVVEHHSYSLVVAGHLLIGICPGFHSY